MKRLHFIVEGQTESEFINSILRPRLERINPHCDISTSLIKTTRGGLSKFTDLKKDLEKCVYQNNIIVTTMIDYYGLPKDFPQYDIAQKETDVQKRVALLQEGIQNEFKTDLIYKHNAVFIPYIQLHEFEALLFSDVEVVAHTCAYGISNQELLTNLHNQRNSVSTPEEINNSQETAPSKRLLNVIKGYNKIVDGERVAKKIGLEKICSECPRFNGWVNQLKELIKE